MNIRTRITGRLRASLPAVVATAIGVAQILGIGGGFTDQATISGSSAGTATLVASTPAATGASATSIDLAWDAVPAGNTAAEFTLQRSASADGANPATVYTGTGSTATDPGNIPASLITKTITAISTGSYHSCAIADGAAYCWGINTSGQLGNGTTTDSPTAVAVTGLVGKTITAVSVGSSSSCATADTTLYCWGSNDYGQLGNGTTTGSSTPVAVSGLTGKTITDVSIDSFHSCAIADGAAYCWGYNFYGQLGNGTTSDSSTPVAVTVLAGKTVTAITASMYFTCAIADGTAYCWGVNWYGQLGNGTTTDSRTAVAVTGLAGKTVTAITTGTYFTCAIADDTAYCWGSNSYGRLGNGTTTNSTTAVAVTSLTGKTVTAIGAGGFHSCAIADGTAYCWGYNYYGQLGNGTTTDSTSAVAVTSLTGKTVTAIGTGTVSSCAIADGTTYCWGSNTYGQLGNGTRASSAAGVATSPIGESVCAAGATSLASTTCSLTQDTTYYYKVDYGIGNWTAPSSAWVAARTAPVTLTASAPTTSTSGTTTLNLSWGAAPAGTNGAQYTVQRSTSPDGSDPETVYTGTATSTTDPGNIPPELRTSAISAISVGDYHSCAVADGAAYCWGNNNYAQLGNGTAISSATPVAVTGLSGKTVTDITAGLHHSCAIADGIAYCWGANFTGQLGNGTSTDSATAVAVTFPTVGAVTDISTAWYHTCALTADGTAYCWGLNGSGQLGNGTKTTSTAPVAVTGLAGKTITDIAAGTVHSCALTSEGIGYCWGSNSYGQLGNGTTTDSTTPVAVTGPSGTTITDIAAGNVHSCALNSDGTVSCWGYNFVGQLGDGSPGYPTTPVTTPVTVTGLTGKTITGITVGGDSSCALTSVGTAFCWGNNNYGQVGDGAIAHARAPVAVTGLTGGTGTTISTVETGQYHSCALASDGTAYCWGFNSRGQVGNGAAGPTVGAPVPITPITGVACEAGATQLNTTTCSLTPGTTYYYRVDYTVDGRTSAAGTWTAVTTGR